MPFNGLSEFNILFNNFTHLHKADLPPVCHSQKNQWTPQHWQQPAVKKESTSMFGAVWVNQWIYVISFFYWVILKSTLNLDIFGKIFFSNYTEIECSRHWPKHAVKLFQFVVDNYHWLHMSNRFKILWVKLMGGTKRLHFNICLGCQFVGKDSNKINKN